METKEKKQKAKPKPKEKTTRITVRIEEEKLEELQKIYEKKYPMQKNTTTNFIKNAIDFFIQNNQNIKTDNEIENIQNEISSIKNLSKNEKINSFDNRIFKNLQKKFTLEFSKEEIIFLIKHIYEEEISKTEYIDQQNSTQIFLFGLQNEEEFFLRMKNFIFKNLKTRHKLKPPLYEILYRQIYNELPNSKEDIELFYEKFAKDTFLLNKKLKIAMKKDFFQSEKEYENLKMVLSEITPKINKIKKCIDELLEIMEKCYEKK